MKRNKSGVSTKTDSILISSMPSSADADGLVKSNRLSLYANPGMNLKSKYSPILRLVIILRFNPGLLTPAA